MSKKILVTGATGSGKTTLETVFRAMGYKTIDIDTGGFAGWINRDTGEAQEYRSDDAEWLKSVDWLLKADDLKEALDNSKSDLVITFGSTNDIHKHLGIFDKVVLLKYPNNESLISRLESRPSYSFGKSSSEREAALAHLWPYQELIESTGADVVDCTLSLNDVVSAIEAKINE